MFLVVVFMFTTSPFATVLAGRSHEALFKSHIRDSESAYALATKGSPMKTVFVLCITFSVFLSAYSQTGRSPMGPETMEQPAYPNSGVRKRTNDVTGEDMSNATHMGSDVDPRVPRRRPAMGKKDEQQEDIKTGPYENGEYQFQSE